MSGPPPGHPVPPVPGRPFPTPGVPAPGIPIPPQPGLIPPGVTPSGPPGIDSTTASSQPAIIPVAPQQPTCTVYVGKIPSTLQDSFVRELLETCGVITKWKRMVDPTTNVPKSFGFCEYKTPEYASRALRMFADRIIVDGKLMLKCNTESQKVLDKWHEGKTEDDREKKDQATQQKLDQLLARVTTEGIVGAAVTDEGVTKANVAAEVAAFRQRLTVREEDAERRRLQNLRAREQSARAADSFLSSITSDADGSSKPNDQASRDPEREYRKLASAVAQRERDILKRKQLQRDREKDREIHIARARKRLASDQEETSDDEYEFKRRFRRDRKRYRDREQHEDEQDRAAEAKEQAQEWSSNRLERLRANEVQRPENPTPSQAQNAHPGTAAPHISQDIERSSDTRESKSTFETVETAATTKKKVVLGLAKKAGKDRSDKPKALDLFAYDDNDSRDMSAPKRQLKKIDYTLEEIRAVDPTYDPEVAAKQRAGQLIQSLPKDPQDLFQYDIAWDVVEGQNIVATKMTEWVHKKMEGYLGATEDAKEFESFVLKKISERETPAAILEHMTMILDEEAPGFIAMMWSKLILETFLAKTISQQEAELAKVSKS